MTKTENYQLSQWDAADPVRREDFNADNAAVDAALNDNAEAITALANKSRFTKLLDVSVTENVRDYEVSLSGINWSKWDKVHIDTITYSSDSSGVLLVTADDSYGTVGFTASYPYWNPRVTIFPGFQSARLVSVLCGNTCLRFSFAYSQLTKIQLSNVVTAGTRVVLWGET